MLNSEAERVRSRGGVSETRWATSGRTGGGEGWKERARGGTSSRLLVGGTDEGGGGGGGGREGLVDLE